MNNQLIVLILLLLSMFGCVSTDSGGTEVHDRLLEIYYLQGPRITVENPCFHCATGEDTLREIVSISLITQLDHDNPEQIQFFGLQGADTGDFSKRVFQQCTRSRDCELFGKIISAGNFEIDIENNGHRYQATGSIGISTIDLQGQFSNDDITIDYDLSGKKVSLKLD